MQGLVAIGPQAIDALLPYVSDASMSGLRYGVDAVLTRLGEQTLPGHGPGQLRGDALMALVDLGGAECLDEVDRRTMERLVRIKLKSERPVRVPGAPGDAGVGEHNGDRGRRGGRARSRRRRLGHGSSSGLLASMASARGVPNRPGGPVGVDVCTLIDSMPVLPRSGCQVVGRRLRVPPGWRDA
ncbi:hypothetical protein [Streptomyces lanatus]|uniref:Uncharacterized protein n=1 Tax=Streptomyces lanatus TaxID=66900 RepID=A0ABV1Y809_9ACTN|nr:hypothetical protein [Streptomyces lanatus]GHH31629.1 hypothetical protein GCM10018780_92760 [Streptomyces lanatus]